MDHSNLGKPPCERRMCKHGNCLDHSPEWENVGKEHYVPDPGFFGQKTYWFERHCDMRLVRYSLVQTQRCKQCGRVQDVIKVQNMGVCPCCGYHKDFTPDTYYG